MMGVIKLEMNIEEAVVKELRKHEYPVTLEGFIVVTPYFSYLVSDMMKENSLERQASILLNSPEIAEALPDDMLLGVGSMVLLQAKCRITGILKNTGIAPFERLLYRVSELKMFPEGHSEFVLNDILLT